MKGFLRLFKMSHCLGFCLAFYISFTLAETKTESSTEKVTESKKLQTFNTINLSGTGNLHIKQSEEESFTIETEKTLLPLVSVYVKDKTLYIDFKDAEEHQKANINYYLSIKNIQTINSYSTAAVHIEKPLKTDVLNLSLHDFGEAFINVEVKKLITQIDGAGKIQAIGSAAEETVQIKGAGEFNGSKLKSQTATIQIEGTGIAKINTTDKLNVTIQGEGIVKFCGEPSINKNISGKGSVTPLESSECSG